MIERQEEIIFRPLGPQGPMVGIEIHEVGDIIALDMAMGELSPGERKTIKGIISAAHMAGLNVIDSSPSPKDKEII